MWRFRLKYSRIGALVNGYLNWVNASLAFKVKKTNLKDTFLDLVVFEILLSEQFFFLLPIAPSVSPARIFSIEMSEAAILLKP